MCRVELSSVQLAVNDIQKQLILFKSFWVLADCVKRVMSVRDVDLLISYIYEISDFFHSFIYWNAFFKKYFNEDCF